MSFQKDPSRNLVIFSGVDFLQIYMVISNVMNTVLDPVSVCPVEWNISVLADFDVPFQGISGFLKNNLYIYSFRT